MKLFDLNNDISQTQESTSVSNTITCSTTGSTIITFAYCEEYKNSLVIKDSIDSEHNEIMSLEFIMTEDSSYYSLMSGSSNPEIRTSAYKKYANILLDDQDDVFTLGSTQAINQAFVITLARSLKSSEIEKETLDMTIVYDSDAGKSGHITDAQQPSETGSVLPYSRNLNSEYRTLYFTDAESPAVTTACGIVFYQSGIIILDPDVIFEKSDSQSWTTSGSPSGADTTVWNTTSTGVLVGDNPTNINVYFGFIDRLTNIDFSTTTIEFYTNYFVKAEANEFNYSSNPTYIDDNGDIVVIGNTINNSSESYTYITGIGLYDDNDNLLAIAKVSKPIKKDWSNARMIKIRVGN